MADTGPPYFLPMLEPAAETDETWKRRAACLGSDPSLFYPHSSKESASAPALEICKQCPVTQECLEYADVHHEQFGVWGNRPESAIRRRRQSGRRKPKSERGAA